MKHTDKLKNQLNNLQQLLDLDFKSNHSIITNSLKRDVKKLLPSL